MGKDASTIRQEIEETRERMGDTVEALAYKADVPSRVKDSMNDRVDAVKDTLGGVMDSVKTAVVGASATVGDTVDQSTRGGANAFSRARDKVNDTVGNISDTVGKVSDRVGKANDDLSDRLQSVDVQGNAQRAVGMVQENPIGLALAALAIGFLIGSLIPVSEAERSRLKPIGDKIVDQAQAATSDLVEAGKAVVMETAQNAVATALGSAQTHGHDVVDAAKTRAQT